MKGQLKTRKSALLTAIALVTLAMCACLLAACATSASSNSIQLGNGSIDAAAVENRGDDVTLVDVRRTEEFAEGHIPGAINIVYDSGTTAEDQVKMYENAGLGKNDIIIVYCRTGVRAERVYNALIEDGYKNIKLYRGGWVDWSESSTRPIEK